MRIRSLLAGAAVLAAGAGMGLVPSADVTARSGEVYPKAVDMAVDYAAKTITITGRLDFYQASGLRPDDAMIASIVSAIESRWNGHKFKCFSVIVKVDARAVNQKGQVRGDAVDVKLDGSRINAGSKVVAAGNDNYLSDDPADRGEPGRETGPETMEPTTWGKYTQPYVWAHEFGHVLGLHDNYVATDGTQVRPGAARDMMFHQKLDVSAEMITRVVRRNNTGQLDESKVRCPISMDAGPATVNVIFASIEDLTVHAYACDYDPPSGDPNHAPKPIQWQGSVSLGGTYNSIIFGSASGTYSGTMSFTSQADTVFPFSPAPGNLDFTGIYSWSPSGLPVSSQPLTLNGVSSAYLGLPLYPVYTEGAAECP